jgi:hypothetical protein
MQNLIERHFLVCRRGPAPRDIQKGTLEQVIVDSLRFPEGWQRPFDMLFDDARERIETAAGGYCEGDGAFGWHPVDTPGVSFCGTIHCSDDRVLTFDIYARADGAAWQRLEQLLGLDDSTCFQFPEWGVMVDRATLLNLLSS